MDGRTNPNHSMMIRIKSQAFCVKYSTIAYTCVEEILTLVKLSLVSCWSPLRHFWGLCKLNITPLLYETQQIFRSKWCFVSRYQSAWVRVIIGRSGWTSGLDCNASARPGLFIINFYYTKSINPIYMDPDYNSPLIYWWEYCNLSIYDQKYLDLLIFRARHRKWSRNPLWICFLIYPRKSP